MQLKEYQQRARSDIGTYLQALAELRDKVEKCDDPALRRFDFSAQAWENAGIRRPYTPRKNGLGRPLPNFCLKIPTGGGKTLLAVETLDLVNLHYRRRKTGLVLWIVPTTQIYRQTIQSLKDRDHPYRQHLDVASAGHTLILEKTDRFSPLDVEENLVVLMLMLPSANRKTKETLRVFKDSGGFQDFFPPEDDLVAQEAMLRRFGNLDTYETVGGFWGRQIKTSLGNTLRTLSPLIILDEGHKAYSEGAQETLRGFNPCMIVELSATPPRESNILVDISGHELHREEMIKLDLHVVNKASPDWRDALLDGINKLNVLSGKAREHEANSGSHIRPICLIQVERTGKEQQGGPFIHSEQVREHLIKVVGVAPEEVAVKTSEKDELKEVDDVGGLLSRDCRIRYIITKQALQEGWDCSFAYVLVILTNPTSKNALTQLVGRILRQPYARKTHLRELDESYVFCFQQKARELLDAIREGFAQEGLGDLRGHIVSDDGPAREGTGRLFEMRERFREAASRTILPVFMVREGREWRRVNYEMDIASRIPWSEADISYVVQLTLPEVEDKDSETRFSLGRDGEHIVERSGVAYLKEGGIRVDPAFMTRQICDIVPNPWQAHEFSRRVLDHYRSRLPEIRIANNFVFLIEELRRKLEEEKERLAKEVFLSLLQEDKLRFLVIGNDWTFPRSIPETGRKLTRKDGSQLMRDLFDYVAEDGLTEPEKAVAWYLDTQAAMFFWYRNRSRHDYGIQGWRHHRIYPDFIFTATDKTTGTDAHRVYVVETKGLHIKDNPKTTYIRQLFKVCMHEATSRRMSEFAPEIEDRVVRYEVLAEDEWEAKLNQLILA